MKKDKIISIIGILTGLLGLYLFVDHISGFTPHDYFYIQNPGITLYVGVNVVSRWADLSFFTYHTLIIFSVWLISYSLSKILNKESLIIFLTKKPIVIFVCGNYLITVLFYTIFELASGNPTFGLYSDNFEAIYNFVTNILVHYLMFIVVIIVFIKVKTNGNVARRHYLIMGLYLLAYYVYVKITGLYAYQIEWYPYPIFDIISVCNLINVSVPNNQLLINFIMIIIPFIVSSGYVLVLYGVDVLKKTITK